MLARISLDNHQIGGTVTQKWWSPAPTESPLSDLPSRGLLFVYAPANLMSTYLQARHDPYRIDRTVGVVDCDSEPN